MSKADQLRRSLILHFATPYVQDEARVTDLRSLCESPLEREVYDELSQRGFWVTPQVRVGQYRIDFVVEGHNDARLAVECDGDKYHGAEKWAEDMQRQRTLERAGWVFWRCFGSAFYRKRKEVMDDLLAGYFPNGASNRSELKGPQERPCRAPCRVVRSAALEPKGGKQAPRGRASRGRKHLHPHRMAM